MQKEYNQILAQEEMFWYQKYRENWVKFENRNTMFFHTQIVVRRRRNKISGLKINGVRCTDVDFLNREALSSFKNIFQSTESCCPES